MSELATSPSPAALTEELRGKQERYEQGGLASSTKRSYAHLFAAWLRYCDDTGTPVWAAADTMEPWFQALKNFLTLRAEEVRASTVKAAITAIKNEATIQEQPFSLAVLNSPQLKRFLDGVLAAEVADGRHRTRQAPVFTHEHLDAVYARAKQEGTVQALRDAALFAVGLGTGLRADNLVRLSLADVERAVSHSGFNFFIGKEKTSQHGNGRYVSLKPATGSLAHRDPVARVEAWLDKHRGLIVTEPGAAPAPLFTQTTGAQGHTILPLADNRSVTDIIRSALVKSGACSTEEAAAFSSHSFRSTFITWALAAGTSQADVSVITGHKSLATMARYNRRAVEDAAHTDYLAG